MGICKALFDNISPVAAPPVPAAATTISNNSPIPADQENIAAAIVPNHVSIPQEGTLPPATSEIRLANKKRRSTTILVVIGILILLLACLVFGGRILRALSEPNQANTLPPVEATLAQALESGIITPIPTVDLQTANMMLDAAIESWRNDDMSMASAQLERMRIAASRNNRFYMEMFQKARDEDAWLLAAIAIFNMDEKTFDQLEANNEHLIHEVVYKAARDEHAGDFFLDHTGNVYLAVAPIRYDLYHKDPQIAKNNLAPLLASNQMIADFPELELLELELFIELNDTEKSKELLEKLLAKPDLPKWIVTEARILGNIVNPIN